MVIFMGSIFMCVCARTHALIFLPIYLCVRAPLYVHVCIVSVYIKGDGGCH